MSIWNMMVSRVVARPAVAQLKALKLAAGPSPNTSTATTQVADYIDQTARYIPTEVITAYVAVSVWQMQNNVHLKTKWWTFVVFCFVTPMIAWIVFAIQRKAAGQTLPIPPNAWPKWKMFAAIIAFAVWSLVLPSGPAADYSFYKTGLSGVILIVFTLLMGLLAKLFDP